MIVARMFMSVAGARQFATTKMKNQSVKAAPARRRRKMSKKGKTAILVWIVFTMTVIFDLFSNKLSAFEIALLFMFCCLIDVLAVKE